MNLAWKDIRHTPVRFALTAVGIGFLIAAAVGMVGLYRGIVADALLIVRDVGADLWVVQGGRVGPFAESSAVSSLLDRRVEGVPGVAGVRRFVLSNQQFEVAGRTLRASVTGLDHPRDTGGWLRLVRGRPLAAGHFEAIADTSVGVAVGDQVRLGQDDYRIVGLTAGMVDSLGDGLLFVTVNDAMAIARRRTGEEVLLARAAAGRTAAAAAGASSVPQDSKVAAVLVTLGPAADPAAVAAAIARWGDADVLSRAAQEDLLLNKRLWRLRVQILAFTAVLLVVMGIVISVIVYSMTLEKQHDIAMLKLIGARNGVIVAMILQQASLLGVAGFSAGLGLAAVVFPLFPRRVDVAGGDLVVLFGVVALICGLASALGIRRALRVRAQEILS
ncbi:ABC transporter permease [Azospirillum sp. A39]|uniref:ABC transporter permease n=1 Tax=Azospirillum sp. A39 TaxID=3462279 RepID=UPI004045F986